MPVGGAGMSRECQQAFPGHPFPAVSRSDKAAADCVVLANTVCLRDKPNQQTPLADKQPILLLVFTRFSLPHLLLPSASLALGEG